jgi:hypothetical protein
LSATIGRAIIAAKIAIAFNCLDMRMRSTRNSVTGTRPDSNRHYDTF